MNKTRPPAKQHAYALKRRNNKKNAFDKLPENPSLSEIQSAVADSAMAELEERVNDVRDSWETDSLFEDVIAEQGAEDVKWDDDGEFSNHSLGDEGQRWKFLSGRLFPQRFIFHLNIRAVTT
jgi:hypothetical protein